MGARSFTFIAVSWVVLLASCGGGGGGGGYNGQPVVVTVTPQITSMAAGTTQMFTATVQNGPTTVGWFSYGTAGTFSQPQVSGNQSTVVYTAPSTPPIYSGTSGDGLSYNATNTQGVVTITAGVPSNANTFNQTVGTVQFPITGPVSAGISTFSTTVKLGATNLFTGYCVGATNNTILWQVNGVTGGSSATGTIVEGALSIGGEYTAPSTMPVTGSTVTISAVCEVDNTKSASEKITLTP
ncbi:MAG TPA: hypothetical protein VFA99_02485 [Acidobacteriaceae bacterium]|nr:hypothetical protein [Acidobacteriaceae bacterium]